VCLLSVMGRIIHLLMIHHLCSGSLRHLPKNSSIWLFAIFRSSSPGSIRSENARAKNIRKPCSFRMLFSPASPEPTSSMCQISGDRPAPLSFLGVFLSPSPPARCAFEAAVAVTHCSLSFTDVWTLPAVSNGLTVFSTVFWEPLNRLLMDLARNCGSCWSALTHVSRSAMKKKSLLRIGGMYVE